MSLRVGFGVSNAQAKLSVCLFLLPVYPDVELSVPPAPRLPAWWHVYAMLIIDGL